MLRPYVSTGAKSNDDDDEDMSKHVVKCKKVTEKSILFYKELIWA